MNYAYIRVSSDKQITDNQKFEIEKFCEKNGISIDEFIEETISGTKNYDKRLLGKLMSKLKSGDLLICSEISRLGRTLFMIMEILSFCMKQNCRVWTIKDGYRMGDDIQSKVLAFAFGLSAEIERNMISQRTKEALKLRVANGVVLGRPLGRTTDYDKRKYIKNKQKIMELYEQGLSFSRIGRELGLNRANISNLINKRGIYNE